MPCNPNKIDYTKGFPTGFSAFESIADPRGSGHTLHHFGEILFMAFTCVLCGVKSYELMEEFCELKEAWFSKWLKLPHGIPSWRTFARVIENIEPGEFTACIGRHLEQIGLGATVRHIALDGKALRGSRSGLQSHLHAVSAWASEQGITLAQAFVGDKGNEPERSGDSLPRT